MRESNFREVRLSENVPDQAQDQNHP